MPGGVTTDGLPNGWAWATVGDLVAASMNGYGKRRQDEGDPTIVLRLADIENQEVSLADPRRVNATADEVEKYRLVPNDLLAIRVNGSADLVGRLIRVGHETDIVLFCDHFIRLRLSEPGTAKFLRLYGNSREFRRHIELNKVSSAGQQTISQGTLQQVRMPLPPLAEQRRIVAKVEELFSDLDAGVAALERVRANLKRYRASVLKAAVEGRLTADWRAAHPAAEPASALLARILADRRKKWEADQLAKFAAANKPPPKNWQAKYKSPVPHEETSLPTLPKTWEWVSLGMLAWSVKDGPHFTPKYSDTGIPFITGGHIRPEGIDFSTAKTISHELHAELSQRCKPEYGDLLYTKGGTTGIARINWEQREFNVWVHVAVLKLADPLDRHFVQIALNSPLCYQQAQRYTHGVGNQDLGLTRMVKIALPLPPLAEQEQIVAEVEERLSVAAVVERQVEADLARAARLRQSILKRAFAGKLVPQDPADEPAAKLLERIRAGREQPAPTPRKPKRGSAPSADRVS